VVDEEELRRQGRASVREVGGVGRARKGRSLRSRPGSPSWEPGCGRRSPPRRAEPDRGARRRRGAEGLDAKCAATALHLIGLERQALEQSPRSPPRPAGGRSVAPTSRPPPRCRRASGHAGSHDLPQLLEPRALASANSSLRRSCLLSSGASASSPQRSNASCHCGWRLQTEIVSYATPTISSVTFREWPCARKKAACRARLEKLRCAPDHAHALQDVSTTSPLTRERRTSQSQRPAHPARKRHQPNVTRRERERPHDHPR
jgi:hypothetical protein